MADTEADSEVEMMDREVDIVLTVSPRTDIRSYFSAWKPVLKSHHTIIVVEDDFSQQNHQGQQLRDLPLLQDISCEIFTKSDAEEFLTSLTNSIKRKSPITLTSLLLNPFTGNSCRSFGFLVCKARFIATFSDNVVPVKTETTGEVVDVVEQHLVNLRSQSTPYYFNTLYDPFGPGSAGFVRGYPFSLRLGVPTAVSHGLALGLPDYDAPTAIVKPQERTVRHVDATVTVPKGSLFPLSACNVAFDRRVMGPCMLLRLGVGGPDCFSGGNVDDVWAGLCAKVVADHLGVGVKSGVPYVWREGKDGEGAALESLKSEFKALLLLEDIVPFFQTLRLSRSATSAEDCYFEIARMVKSKLRSLDPGFEALAAAMSVWADAWKFLNES